MSVPVAVEDIARVLADDGYGPGYLLTTSAEHRVKAVMVEPAVADGVLRVEAPGRGSCRNVTAHPEVTVLFPPPAPRGFTLLVDGVAELDGDDVVVRAASAVLHRPAAHADGASPEDGGVSGCGDDCRPVR